MLKVRDGSGSPKLCQMGITLFLRRAALKTFHINIIITTTITTIIITTIITSSTSTVIITITTATTSLCQPLQPLCSCGTFLAGNASSQAKVTGSCGPSCLPIAAVCSSHSHCCCHYVPAPVHMLPFDSCLEPYQEGCGCDLCFVLSPAWLPHVNKCTCPVTFWQSM